MSDYIRREDAIDDLHTQLMYRMGSDDMKRRLDDWVKTLPPADVVQVVRCKDCLFFTTEKSCCRPEGLIKAREDAFCSYGEKRVEE